MDWTSIYPECFPAYGLSFSDSVVSLKTNMHTYAVNFLKQGDI